MGWPVHQLPIGRWYLHVRICATVASRSREPFYNLTCCGLCCRFKVLNERAPAIFLYARNVTIGTNGTVEWDESDNVTGFQDTDIVAASPVLPLAAPNEPTHVHMSYTDTEG